jgi:uncharacterized membrane protein
LPPPEILARYSAIIPDAPERFLTMVEKQVDHRIHLEKTVIESDTKNSKLGLWLGFIIALAFLLTSAFLILNGHELVGGIIGAVDIVALVTAFIYGSNNRKNERIQKEHLAEQHKAKQG